MRNSYIFTILVTPTQPLTHGAGNDGNTQILRRTQRNVQVGDEWVQLDVPAVSGSALKATLREHAVEHYLEVLGVPEGSLSRDALRLLLKGGKVGTQGQSIQHDQIRQMRRLFPPLAVFGFMDGALTAPGLLQSCELVPYTRDLVAAGFFEDLPIPHASIPDELTTTEVTYYRHDSAASRTGSRYLTAGDRRQIEDAQASRAGKVAGKEQRRDANESMPHTFEAITAGTPLVGTLRLTGASDIDLACFALAVARWRQHGAHLGGGRGKGHGACMVKMLSATRLTGAGPVPIETDVTLPTVQVPIEAQQDEFVSSYAQYVAGVRDEALAAMKAC